MSDLVQRLKTRGLADDLVDLILDSGQIGQAAEREKSLFAEATDEIERLTAELASARQDAARYRWLREKSRSQVLPMVRVQIMRHGQYVLRSYEELDAAIDAAIGEKA